MVQALPLLIFVATYALISLRRIARFPLERPAVALLGGSLMILARVLTPAEAVAAVDLDTILLLIGMMTIVVVLEATGVFTYIALWIVEHSRTQTRLLVGVGVATAVLSALILNDAVVLFLTPILIHACRRLHIPPLKFLIVEAASANVGSVATEVGNPQNAYIGSHSGIPFGHYVIIMGPLAALTLAGALGLVILTHRKQLAHPLKVPDDLHRERAAAIKHRGLLYLCFSIVLIIFAGFILGPRYDLPLSMIALSGASLLVFFAPLLAPVSPRAVFRRVDWNIILLFVGLFIVLKAVGNAGILTAVFDLVENASAGALHTIAGLGLVATVASNLISNVPATLLLAPLLKVGEDTHLWYTLAAATTLSGNATVVGAAANIIVAERAEEDGIAVGFWSFFKIGFPVTLLTLAIAFVYLRLVT